MGRFAKIEADGVVSNIIVASPEFIAGLPDAWVEVDDAVEIGSVKDGEEYIPTQVVELGLARSIRKAMITAAFQADLADGITVGPLTLLAGDFDQAQFDKGMGVCTTALNRSAATGSTMISAVFGRGVTDASGTSHDMTVNDYLDLCLAYALAVGTQQSILATKLAAIDAAQTKAEIDAITWSDE